MRTPRDLLNEFAAAIDAFENKQDAEEKARHWTNVASQAQNDVAKAKQQAEATKQEIDDYLAKRKSDADKIQKDLDAAHKAHSERMFLLDEQSKAQAEDRGKTLDALQAEIRDATAVRDSLTAKIGELTGKLREAAANFA